MLPLCQHFANVIISNQRDLMVYYNNDLGKL